MTERQQALLSALEKQKWGPTAYDLRWTLNYPEASIRRDVGSLRAQGYKITNNGNGYKLVTR